MQTAKFILSLKINIFTNNNPSLKHCHQLLHWFKPVKVPCRTCRTLLTVYPKTIYCENLYCFLVLEEITSPSSNAKLIEVVFLGTPIGWEHRFLCVSLPTGITQSVLRYDRNEVWSEQQGIPLGWKLLLLECLPFLSLPQQSVVCISGGFSLFPSQWKSYSHFFTTPHKRLPSLGMMKWTFKCMHSHKQE